MPGQYASCRRRHIMWETKDTNCVSNAISCSFETEQRENMGNRRQPQRRSANTNSTNSRHEDDDDDDDEPLHFHPHSLAVCRWRCAAFVGDMARAAAPWAAPLLGGGQMEILRRTGVGGRSAGRPLRYVGPDDAVPAVVFHTARERDPSLTGAAAVAVEVASGDVDDGDDDGYLRVSKNEHFFTFKDKILNFSYFLALLHWLSQFLTFAKKWKKVTCHPLGPSSRKRVVVGTGIPNNSTENFEVIFFGYLTKIRRIQRFFVLNCSVWCQKNHT